MLTSEHCLWYIFLPEFLYSFLFNDELTTASVIQQHICHYSCSQIELSFNSSIWLSAFPFYKIWGKADFRRGVTKGGSTKLQVTVFQMVGSNTFPQSTPMFGTTVFECAGIPRTVAASENAASCSISITHLQGRILCYNYWEDKNVKKKNVLSNILRWEAAI